MKSIAFAAGLVAACLSSNFAQAQEVHVQTSLGTFDVALDPVHAPKATANFLRYVREGHFDGTMIYRVVPGFVLQMGSYEPNGDARPTHDPIPLESANGLLNQRGTLSMARSDDPNSATAEFFINLTDNNSLDPTEGKTPNTTGYAVFGKVVEGMSVIDTIAAVPLNGKMGPFPDAAPAAPVIITKVTVVGDPVPPPAPTKH
jgi:cyclophilin family peptidyl-prolyl cis-trans isomerase